MSALPVAVIDSGIIENAFAFSSEVQQIKVKKHRWTSKNNVKDTVQSHGTVVCAILTKYAMNVKIYSVRVFCGDCLSTDCRTLVQALTWCYRHKIPLINLSLGTTEKSDFITVDRIVSKMAAQGQIIVSAYHMNGSVTMPASHPAVIGVHTTPGLREYSFYPDFSQGKSDFIASSQHIVCINHGRFSFQTALSTSFAVPTITAAFANCMTRYPGKDRSFYEQLVAQQSFLEL